MHRKNRRCFFANYWVEADAGGATKSLGLAILGGLCSLAVCEIWILDWSAGPSGEFCMVLSSIAGRWASSLRCGPPLFSWKIAGKLWNRQGERRSNILNDLFCVCLKTHFPSFWNPAKSAFWSFAGDRYKYMDLPLPASGTTMQWWPQTCRGNPFSESSQPFSTTSSSRVSKKSIIDLKDRLLRLIHASLDANLQSSIFTVIEVSLQLLFCAKPWLSTVKKSKSSLS